MSTFEDKLSEAKEKYTKASVSIPNGAVVKALLTGIKYTKKGKEAASINGGIGVSFCFLGYYNNDMTQYTPTIDYSDPANIKFPADVRNADGTIERPGLMSKPIYVSPGTIGRKGLVAAEDEVSNALLYTLFIGRVCGIQMQEPFISCLASSGLVKITPEQCSLESFRKDFPVVHLYRNTEWKYSKSDYVDGVLKSDAVEQFNEELGTWKKGSKKDDPAGNALAEVPLEFLSAETTFAIIDALAARQEAKKLEQSPGTPF